VNAGVGRVDAADEAGCLGTSAGGPGFGQILLCPLQKHGPILRLGHFVRIDGADLRQAAQAAMVFASCDSNKTRRLASMPISNCTPRRPAPTRCASGGRSLLQMPWPPARGDDRSPSFPAAWPYGVARRPDHPLAAVARGVSPTADWRGHKSAGVVFGLGQGSKQFLVGLFRCGVLTQLMRMSSPLRRRALSLEAISCIERNSARSLPTRFSVRCQCGSRFVQVGFRQVDRLAQTRRSCFVPWHPAGAEIGLGVA